MNRLTSAKRGRLARAHGVTDGFESHDQRRTRLQELSHQIGPIEEPQLRAFEISRAQHRRQHFYFRFQCDACRVLEARN